MIIIALSCSSCLNSNVRSPEETQNSKEDRIKGQLEQIESAFAKGNSEKACKLQVNLSKNLDNYKNISRELINDLNKFQIKCGSQVFSIEVEKP